MCRAHGIPHQRVAAIDDLCPALRSAWGSNRHSVVEVVTSRTSNVQRHREVQAAVKQAVGRALALLERHPYSVTAGAAAEGALPADSAVAAWPFELAVDAASYHAYSLPLAKPLTSADAAAPDVPGELPRRRGFLLYVSLAAGAAGPRAHGVGEVAPLPGLHAESLQQAEAQLALLCQLLAGSSGGGVRVPAAVALLGGRMGQWLRQGLGMEPETLLPSVRCGLEAAVLSALAQASVGRLKFTWAGNGGATL